MHGGPPSEVVRHLYYYNTLEPGVQSTAPDDIHHHHPLPAAALVAMDPTGGRGGDSRYNLNYSMSIGLNMTEGGGGGVQDMYGNPTSSSLVRPGMSMNNSRSLMAPNNNNNNNNTSQSSVCLPNNSTGGGTSGGQRGIKRTNSDCFDDRAMGSSQQQQQQQQQQQLGSMDGCGPVGGAGSGGVPDVVDESYAALQKKSPPANGKKTKGRVKIKMEYIDNKLRRYTTFSKRKTGIMKKAYELSTLTGTQVMLLVASETGHVYTFATRKLQPMITSEAGKQLIQTCLNSPDPPSGATTGDQRMSATGFEETELSYNIADEDSKDDRSPMSSGESGDESSGLDSPGPSGTASANNIQHTSNTIEAQHNSSAAAIGATVRHPPGPTHSQQQQQHHHGMQAMSQHHGHIQQQQQQPPHHQPVDGEANKGQMNNPANSVIYPAAALANVPQDVLLSLVQAGHLQVHQEENGAQQYITIPLSMMSGGVLGKMAIKDPTIVGGSSSHGVASNMATSTPSATSVHRGGVSANGRDSPSLTPMELIIKKENIE